MHEKQDWVEWIKDLPNWIKGALGLTTAIIGFIALILSNAYLGVTVSFAIVLIALFGSSAYIAFSKKKSELVDGRYIYRFPNYCRLGLAGVVLIPVVIIMLLANESSRNFAVIAFVGTATSTPTATPTPTVTPADTPIPPTVTPTSTVALLIQKICIELDRNQNSTVDISGGEVELSLTTGGRICLEIEVQEIGQLPLEIKTPIPD